MPYPTGSSEAKTIAYLDTDWKLATVYAFMEPKPSRMCTIHLWEKKVEGRHAPVIKQPVKWITEARETLMADGFLVRRITVSWLYHQGRYLTNSPIITGRC